MFVLFAPFPNPVVVSVATGFPGPLVLALLVLFPINAFVGVASGFPDPQPVGNTSRVGSETELTTEGTSHGRVENLIPRILRVKMERLRCWWQIGGTVGTSHTVTLENAHRGIAVPFGISWGYLGTIRQTLNPEPMQSDKATLTEARKLHHT